MCGSYALHRDSVVYQFGFEGHDGPCQPRSMDNRSSKRKKREHDFAVTAFNMVQQATRQDTEEQTTPEPEPEDTEGKTPHVVALGRMGGKKGAPARAKKLTPEQRSESAKGGTGKMEEEVTQGFKAPFSTK